MRFLLSISLLVVAASLTKAHPSSKEPRSLEQDAPSERRPQNYEEDYYEDDVVYEEEKEEEDDQLVIPTIDPERVRQVLQSKEQTRKMVDCVIYFEDGCPPELEKVNRMAPEIFRRGGRCYRCTKDDQNKLREFLVELQRHQPSEYRRMIRELNKI